MMVFLSTHSRAHDMKRNLFIDTVGRISDFNYALPTRNQWNVDGIFVVAVAVIQLISERHEDIDRAKINDTKLNDVQLSNDKLPTFKTSVFQNTGNVYAQVCLANI